MSSTSTSTSSNGSSSSTSEGSTSRLYALHDQWHVTSVATATGTVVERYAYDAFGTSIVLGPSFAVQSVSHFDWETRFGAYRFDEEIGLYCVRFRYLHPGLGRWISRDPIGLFGSNTRNLFIYIYNRPSWAADVLGLKVVTRASLGPCENYVTCCKNTFKIHLFEVDNPTCKARVQPYDKIPSISDCIAEHEQVHCDYFKKHAKDLCKDVECGTVTLGWDDNREKEMQECEATNAEYVCLLGKIHDGSLASKDYESFSAVVADINAQRRDNHCPGQFGIQPPQRKPRPPKAKQARSCE